MPEGDGAHVRRLMPVHGLMNFDPFVLLDHFDIAAGGFPAHPHRGFEAVTYLFAGGMRHTDNLGNQGTIYAGGAQRFTAGAGIVHAEMPEGHTAGIQLWINLPRARKGMPPGYQQVQPEAIPERRHEGAIIRTIVGEGSPLQLQTAVEYLDVRLDAAKTWQREVPKGFRGLIYIASGQVVIGDHVGSAAEACLVDSDGVIKMNALAATRLLWCFGRPLGEPIHQRGPFVD